MQLHTTFCKQDEKPTLLFFSKEICQTAEENELFRNLTTWISMLGNKAMKEATGCKPSCQRWFNFVLYFLLKFNTRGKHCFRFLYSQYRKMTFQENITETKANGDLKKILFQTFSPAYNVVTEVPAYGGADLAADVGG